eukprot:15432165-Alexandrium_andersonii.AAC.1
MGGPVGELQLRLPYLLPPLPNLLQLSADELGGCRESADQDWSWSDPRGAPVPPIVPLVVVLLLVGPVAPP